MKKKEERAVVLTSDTSWHIIAIPTTDREEIEIQTKAMKYRCALSDLDNFLRSQCKYGPSKEVALLEDNLAVMQYVREKLFEICRDNDVDLL